MLVNQIYDTTIEYENQVSKYVQKNLGQFFEEMNENEKITIE